MEKIYKFGHETVVLRLFEIQSNGKNPNPGILNPMGFSGENQWSEFQ